MRYSLFSGGAEFSRKFRRPPRHEPPLPALPDNPRCRNAAPRRPLCRRARISAAACALLILSGCSYTAGDMGALQGAAIGGAVGAGGGQAIGRNTKATIGAAAGGAVIGGVLGYLLNSNKTRYCHYYDNDGFPYDAPCGKP